MGRFSETVKAFLVSNGGGQRLAGMVEAAGVFLLLRTTKSNQHPRCLAGAVLVLHVSLSAWN